jgi:ketosteroid isomerase-like protein
VVVSIGEILEREGFDEFVAALDPNVVWVGIRPGQLCRNRDEVVAIFRRALEQGHSGTPEIVAQTDELLVVDPHVDPPLELNPELHHVFTLRDGRIVEMRDFPDRASALQAAGLS